MWLIKPLRLYFFQIPFVIFTDHKALKSLDKVGEHHVRVQRCLEFLNAYRYKLVYCIEKAKVTATVMVTVTVKVPQTFCHAFPCSPQDVIFRVIQHSPTYPEDVDAHSVGESGLRPRLVNAAPASAPLSLLTPSPRPHDPSGHPRKPENSPVATVRSARSMNVPVSTGNAGIQPAETTLCIVDYAVAFTRCFQWVDCEPPGRLTHRT